MRPGTDTLQLTAAEMSAIAASFSDKSEPKAVIANGVKVNGQKYMTIESTDDSLKAKKVRATHANPHIKHWEAKCKANTTHPRARKASSPTKPRKPSSSPTTRTRSKQPTPTPRSSSWANTSRRSATKRPTVLSFVYLRDICINLSTRQRGRHGMVWYSVVWGGRNSLVWIHRSDDGMTIAFLGDLRIGNDIHNT
jgi:hypothetical protein